jgi:hypothetical protein
MPDETLLEFGQLNAEGAEVTQSTQKETRQVSFSFLRFPRVSATSAFKNRRSGAAQ